MARYIDSDELAEKMQGFTIIWAPDGLAMECADCGGVWDVTCPDIEAGPHSNLNSLLGAAANHNCELPDMACPPCIARIEEAEDSVQEEIEVGLAMLEDYLEQINNQEE